ncbi:hypothetical protein EBI01_02420 [Marinomonas rhizomae]|uniref:Uncharacterized protein n=1 Tax=Marinomonas rhizomae TaxID=491948 RepID=A0A366JFB8_9GAMM|nr:hypothetical protein [Marinomonas rhizomae]RBP85666.1 hypothetical protein DFP80_101161 [Marinomonas rhizomae]RNF75709.1 hypothetical protein EBI01_02420 [Marinomonas rhizomae]
MNALNSKSFFSHVLGNVKIVGLSGVFDKLVSLFKSNEKVAKAPSDMEVDNLEWYRTFPVKK